MTLNECPKGRTAKETAVLLDTRSVQNTLEANIRNIDDLDANLLGQELASKLVDSAGRQF